MPTLTIHYKGGPLDGTTRTSTDDQVPFTVCTSEWERYQITSKAYSAGLLVRAVYSHQGRA